MNDTQKLAEAFYAGQDAYQADKALESNPFGVPTDGAAAYQWDRGYRNARKHARFNATIAARQKNKAKRG